MKNFLRVLLVCLLFSSSAFASTAVKTGSLTAPVEVGRNVLFRATYGDAYSASGSVATVGKYTWNYYMSPVPGFFTQMTLADAYDPTRPVYLGFTTRDNVTNVRIHIGTYGNAALNFNSGDDITAALTSFLSANATTYANSIYVTNDAGAVSLPPAGLQISFYQDVPAPPEEEEEAAPAFTGGGAVNDGASFRTVTAATVMGVGDATEGFVNDGGAWRQWFGGGNPELPPGWRLEPGIPSTVTELYNVQNDKYLVSLPASSDLIPTYGTDGVTEWSQGLVPNYSYRAYYGTQKGIAYYFSTQSSGGIIHSTDGGRTWLTILRAAFNYSYSFRALNGIASFYNVSGNPKQYYFTLQVPAAIPQSVGQNSDTPIWARSGSPVEYYNQYLVAPAADRTSGTDVDLYTATGNLSTPGSLISVALPFNTGTSVSFVFPPVTDASKSYTLLISSSDYSTFSVWYRLEGTPATYEVIGPGLLAASLISNAVRRPVYSVTTKRYYLWAMHDGKATLASTVPPSTATSWSLQDIPKELLTQSDVSGANPFTGIQAFKGRIYFRSPITEQWYSFPEPQ